MRARRPRRFAFRPALDVLPLRLAPSGGLTLELPNSGQQGEDATTGQTPIIHLVDGSGAVQQTETDRLT